MTRIFTVFLSLVILSSTRAQDTSVEKVFSVPIGIYYTPKSFFAKKPDISTPFQVIKTQIDNPRYSTGYGYTFVTSDSIKLKQEVFGFFDGKDMYVKLDNGLRGGGTYWTKRVLIMEYFKLLKHGRHAYIIKYSYDFYENKKEGVIVPESMFYKDINHLTIYYLSKKKELINATPDGIGFLLKKDKDLYEQYSSEKARTPDVLRKYLDKMNERYPNWEPDYK